MVRRRRTGHVPQGLLIYGRVSNNVVVAILCNERSGLRMIALHLLAVCELRKGGGPRGT